MFFLGVLGKNKLKMSFWIQKTYILFFHSYQLHFKKIKSACSLLLFIRPWVFKNKGFFNNFLIYISMTILSFWFFIFVVFSFFLGKGVYVFLGVFGKNKLKMSFWIQKTYILFFHLYQLHFKKIKSARSLLLFIRPWVFKNKGFFNNFLIYISMTILSFWFFYFFCI
jgi:hypothetical protein